MRKKYALLFAGALLLAMTAGCSGETAGSQPQTQSKAQEDKAQEDKVQEDKVQEETGTENTVIEEIPAQENGDLEADTPENGIPSVYMTTQITPEALVSIYEALSRPASGNVAVKISTGEPGGRNFLQPSLIADLVQKVDGTIVESNTAYGGSRANTAMHLQAAKDHGFTEIAEVVILDADGETELPVPYGGRLSENIIGAAYLDYDFTMVLSHFKGHSMAGFGGAIKNISIGIASSAGKLNIHSGGEGTSLFGGDQDAFLESMAEAAGTIMEHNGENILYINVMNRLSVDCDCDSNPAEPDMHDIGILASLDPVALDRACIDLVYDAPDGQSLVERIESRNGAHTLEHAAGLGLGSLTYDLVSIDG